MAHASVNITGNPGTVKFNLGFCKDGICNSHTQKSLFLLWPEEQHQSALSCQKLNRTIRKNGAQQWIHWHVKSFPGHAGLIFPTATHVYIVVVSSSTTVLSFVLPYKALSSVSFDVISESVLLFCDLNFGCMKCSCWSDICMEIMTNITGFFESRFRKKRTTLHLVRCWEQWSSVWWSFFGAALRLGEQNVFSSNTAVTRKSHLSFWSHAIIELGGTKLLRSDARSMTVFKIKGHTEESLTN